MRVGVLALALLLAGCATWDVREVRDPQSSHSLIGMTIPDLVLCMGKPDAVMLTKPDEAVVQYVRKDTNTGFKATLGVLGSVEFGGAGGCTATFDVLRSGEVVDVDFPQSYSDSLFAAPYESCRTLVLECLRHPGSTGLPADYDAWLYLQPDRKPM